MRDIRPQDILFWAGGNVLEKYGTLVRRTSPFAVPELVTTRASQGWMRGRDGIYRTAQADVPRVEWADAETPLLLVEGVAQTNILHDSADFAAGTAWETPEHWALAAATSLVAGQTAQQHTNDGLGSSRERAQSRGTYSGGPETLSVLVENVDAAAIALNLRNSTANANIIVQLDLATGETSVLEGAGTVGAVQLADSGPNGGPVYRFWVTGTHPAGNFRRSIVYPTGRGVNTQTVILHHAQHVEGNAPGSVIVTGAGSDTREAETVVAPWPHPPQAMTLLIRGREDGGVLSDAFANLIRVGAGGSRLQIQTDSGIHRYQIRYDSNGTTRFRTADVAPEIGQWPALMLKLSKDGVASLTQSINGGAESTVAAAALALPSAWGSQFITIGGGAFAYQDILGVRGADWPLSQLLEFVA